MIFGILRNCGVKVMTIVLNVADVASIRRLAVGALMLLELGKIGDEILREEAIKSASKLIEILNRLTYELESNSIDLLEEPWDRIVERLSRIWFIDPDINKYELIEKLRGNINTLKKLINQTKPKLKEYEKEELKEVLEALIDVSLAREAKMIRMLRG